MYKAFMTLAKYLLELQIVHTKDNGSLGSLGYKFQ
jgi:hypothetical protein